MTREQVKKLLPIMQAYAEGKTIQFLNGGKWYDVYDTDFYQSPDVYRIKPESNYRPFNSKEECWNEMMKHQPLGWIRNTDLQCLHNITSIGYNNYGICLDNSIMHFDTAFNDFTFVDGTPFGIKDE